MKKLIFGTCVAGIVVVGLFYACKKDSSEITQKDVEVKEQPLIKGMSGADTIYIPTSYEIWCADCNDCYNTGGSCLPNINIFGNRFDIKMNSEVFAAVINADNYSNSEERKRNIIKNNKLLFNKFITDEWLSRIENGTGSISCIKQYVNKYFFSLSLKSRDGFPTCFIIGENEDDSHSFNELIFPVVLIEETETTSPQTE